VARLTDPDLQVMAELLGLMYSIKADLQAKTGLLGFMYSIKDRLFGPMICRVNLARIKFIMLYFRLFTS
jgi:hypothetical protein